MEAARIVSLRRIRAGQPHSAFPDLARFRGAWYCVFREADNHVGSIGRVRLIVSPDGVRWKTTAVFAETGVDLRDPRLSVAPGRRLMLVMGGSEYRDGRFLRRQPRVAFSTDGTSWSPPAPVLEEGDWLWRVTWHDGRAYGVSYRLLTDTRWVVELYASEDGVDWTRVERLRVGGRPNEATIRFHNDGRALLLVRREGGDRQAWIGTSRRPWRTWRWNPSGHRFGGPNLVILPDGSVWAGGRTFPGGEPRVTIGCLDAARYVPTLELPSGGDCGYPGMVWHGGLLWVCYYSSHEGSAGIYLARVKLPFLDAVEPG